VLADRLDLDPPTHDGLQFGIARGGLDAGEPPVWEVAQARAEAKTQSLQPEVDRHIATLQDDLA
jgi:hypothetical protein